MGRITAEQRAQIERRCIEAIEQAGQHASTGHIYQQEYREPVRIAPASTGYHHVQEWKPVPERGEPQEYQQAPIRTVQPDKYAHLSPELARAYRQRDARSAPTGPVPVEFDPSQPHLTAVKPQYPRGSNLAVVRDEAAIAEYNARVAEQSRHARSERHNPVGPRQDEWSHGARPTEQRGYGDLLAQLKKE